MPTIIEETLLRKMKTNQGHSIMDLSNKSSIMLVFLRHFGCVFCKEALEDLSKLQSDFKAKNAETIFVHMGTNAVAEQYFKDFGLENVQHVSDPERIYYYEFGLRKGSFSQLYGLRTWFRGFSPENKNYKLELAKHLGDSTQMPGIFVLQDGEVIEEYIHKQASDRPDYNHLLKCCVNP